MSLQSPSKPPNFPLELWERTFLHLAPEQIVKLGAVNRSFRDVIDGSPEAQFLIDLYAAGLEVEHWDPSVSLADRRQQLDRYRSRWDSLQCTDRALLPPFCLNLTVEGGVVCSALTNDSADYRFIQLPSVLRGIPLEEWTLHGLPANSFSAILPEEDLFVTCSPTDNRRSFIIQLLRMSDGQPHPDASIPTINGPGYQYEQARSVRRIVEVKVTASRLVTMVSIEPLSAAHFLVWDWKTGVKYVDMRRSMTIQFVDEHRIFGVPYATISGSGLPKLVTLLDTSTPAENPRRPKEMEFELDNVEGPASLIKGTYVQGAKLGSSFRTDRKKHVLGIAHTYNSGKTFVIDYENICAIASENKSSSRIPWDLWKRKTTRIGHYAEFSSSLMLAGPRAFSISRNERDELLIWSFDFTPGACRHIEELSPSSKVVPPHAIRCVKLTDKRPELEMASWDVSEDNILCFSTTWGGTSHDLRIWTF